MAAKQKYMRATLEEDEILADGVKKYPALYGKRIKDYKDRNVNNNAWTANCSRDGIAFRKTVSFREIL